MKIKRMIQPNERVAYLAQIERARAREKPDAPLFDQRVEFAWEEHLRRHDPPIVSRETVREICSAHDAALWADCVPAELFEATVKELKRC